MGFKIGIGRDDVTGPCLEIGFMGMSRFCQTGKGIHTRLHSRAFVIEDLANKKNIAIVCADLGACTLAVKDQVVKKLKDSGPLDQDKQPLFNDNNVMITATHTHSGPGGYSHYLAYNASIRGFNQQNFEQIVKGIFGSIIKAYHNKQPGKIFVHSADLDECGGIRSIGAYKMNPEVTDKELTEDMVVEPLYKKMTLLKFMNDQGESIGTINWFALHPTNMGELNKLISGDNKGYAEQLFEKSTGVMAAFANSCCGDISPNSWKDDQGIKFKRPDGKTDALRTEIFAKKQFKKALDLYDMANKEITGNIDYRHEYCDMSDCRIDGTDRKTWPPALGFGMVNGSQEDSTGMKLKEWGEGTTKNNITHHPERFKKLVKIATSIFQVYWQQPIDPAIEKGHGNKAILFPLSQLTYKNYPIAPTVLPLQIVRIGTLLLVGHPGELTTVAGIRIRKALGQIWGSSDGIDDIVIACYANAFSSYTTTPEEYAVQQYEGASTLFGPWQLDAYIQEYCQMAQALREGKEIEPGPSPKTIPDESIKKIPSVWARPDEELPGLKFGEFDEIPKSNYKMGETVRISFLGGHLNRSQNLSNSYFKIEIWENTGWQRVYADDDFCTQLIWDLRGTASIITIEWIIPKEACPGKYRIVFEGPLKKLVGAEIEKLQVSSDSFQVS